VSSSAIPPTCVSIPVHHDRLSTAFDDVGVHVDHVVPVRYRSVLVHGAGRLRHRLAFPCQSSLIGGQGIGLDDAGVRRHRIPLLQDHNIAGNHLRGINLLLASVPQNRGVRRRHLLQRLNGLLRTVVLDKTKYAVGEQYQHDYTGLAVLRALTWEHPDTNRKYGRNDKQVDQVVLELADEYLQRRRLVLLTYLVLTVLLQPLLGLLIGETLIA
jgi:hypothetical protein